MGHCYFLRQKTAMTENKHGLVVSLFHPHTDLEILDREKDLIMMFKRSRLWPSTPSATCMQQP